MLQFKVVCFKHDVGIFTCFGAKVKSNSPTPVDPHFHPNGHPGPCGPHGPHMVCEPSFRDKVMYDVVLYTNPELTQSLIIYSDKNINVCRLVLNNFITMILNGQNIIDINKINDKTPIKLIECHHDEFGEHHHHHDHHHFPEYPCDNPWDKDWHDPRKNPYVDVFDMTHEHHHCPEDFDHHHHHHHEEPIDCHRMPLPDGDEMHFDHHHHHPHDCFGHHDHHHDPIYNIERAVTKVIPNHLERILHEVTPPERRPENQKKIVFYYGNGGIAMGGSAVNDISEMCEHALKDMLRKNGRSTFCTSADKIDIERVIKKTVLETDEFRVNKVTDKDWAFFMIPDRFMGLIKNFNFYYQEDMTDNTWVEVTEDMDKITREFTIQDNGVRYYVVAMRMTGNYAVKFAKSGQTTTVTDPENQTPDSNGDSGYEGDNTEWTGTIRLNISGDVSTKTFAYIDSSEVSTNITLDTMGNATISGLPEGEVFELVSVDGDSSTSYCFFKVYQKADGSTSLQKSNEKDGVYSDVEGTTIVITI